MVHGHRRLVLANRCYRKLLANWSDYSCDFERVFDLYRSFGCLEIFSFANVNCHFFWSDMNMPNSWYLTTLQQYISLFMCFCINTVNFTINACSFQSSNQSESNMLHMFPSNRRPGGFYLILKHPLAWLAFASYIVFKSLLVSATIYYKKDLWRWWQLLGYDSHPWLQDHWYKLEVRGISSRYNATFWMKFQMKSVKFFGSDGLNTGFLNDGVPVLV